MANAFVNFLSGFFDGSGNLRDYQHAARLYLTNNYELTPKNGWIYYVVININPDLQDAITDDSLREEFNTWYTKYKGTIGLLAKKVDVPSFSIETETLNQYNKKTNIQKKITYNDITVTFHDDMANATTNLWKAYYQYYYGDSLGTTFNNIAKTKTAKYTDNKYNEFNGQLTYNYGLNNGQTIPFFTSFDIYQLNQKKFTSFKIINPMIKEWKHDDLDQTDGTKMLTSQMTVIYETVVYDTSPINDVTKETPGFNKTYYDNTPSPISIGGQGTTSVLGPGGLIAGAKDVFGTLTNPGASPLDLLNTAIKGRNIVRNAKNISKAGLIEEGTGVLTSVLSSIEQTPAVPGQPVSERVVSGALSGLNKVFSPVGITIPSGNKTTNQQTTASPVKLSNSSGS